MKTLLQLVLVISILFAATDNYPQQQILSAGKAPFNKANSHITYGNFDLADIAYAHDNSQGTNITMPIPAGNPFTVLGNFSAPNFAASMCKDGDGHFYLLDVAPALYLFDPNSGTCTLIGNITGMGGDQPNGIAYNPDNNNFYMCSSTALYTLDINTLAANLVGQFSPAISGLMIDLCFDSEWTCFAYEVNINPGAANGYIIDITNAHLTALGYLGYTPNYGQGMSYDFETNTIYLSAFNSDTFSGQLRTMDPATGMTTLVYDWGDQIAPFALETCSCPPPCFIDPANNPNPPNNSTDISINGTMLSWDNGVGTINVEVWFGPQDNIIKIYDDTLITSLDTGPLEYFTTYQWYIVDKNDSCGTNGPHWSFRTEQNPNLVTLNFYPASSQYWTGSTDGAGKFDGEINTVYPNVGWASYDISEIPVGSTIQEVHFYGYVNATNWPYWSATPMSSVNPVTDDANAINSQILANWAQDVAYIYSDESSAFTTGWVTYMLINNAVPDLQSAVNSGQGWIAMGFVDRDFSSTYFLNFDGWSQSNPPYIAITYIPPIPVELTSFRADVQDRKVVLNWITATETNNRGFIVQRQSSNANQSINQWSEIGFVEGNGTTTTIHQYSFTDKNVSAGKYKYRLKQTDFDGSYNYSEEIEVEVTALNNFSLEQNYPNPFNPTTRINFSLRSDSRVTLNIYNVLGQKVSELLNDRMNAGTFTVEFDASRPELTSGIYFYTLTANGSDGNNFIATKKMMLLK